MVAFLATKINKEQQLHQKTFLETLLQWLWVRTTNMSKLSMSSIKVWLSTYFLLLANSLFLSSLKTPVSLVSKKSISHENLNIKDISYRQQVFPS